MLHYVTTGIFHQATNSTVCDIRNCHPVKQLKMTKNLTT